MSSASPNVSLKPTIDNRRALDRVRKTRLRQTLKAAGLKETTVCGSATELEALRELIEVVGVPLFSPRQQLGRAQRGEDGVAIISKNTELLRKKAKAPARASAIKNSAGEVGCRQDELLL